MSTPETQVNVRTNGLATKLNAPTWRYIGERDAADLAYCVRFNTTVAPEPTVAPGGALAYAVPTVERRS